MSKQPETSVPLARQLSLQAVIDAFLEHGSITRSQLTELTGLSKQTMSEVVRDLEQSGWLREAGQSSGSVGRRAAIYEFQESACQVLGVDLGGNTLRLAVAALNGAVLAEDSVETDPRGGIYVVDQIAAQAARLIARPEVNGRSLRMAVVAVSGVAQQSTGAVLAASNIAGIGNINFAGLLSGRLGLPLVVENAVDMATKGERWQGCARAVDNFVFLGHGAGIGMGAVIDGHLLKGRRGAIGEIAFLPLGGTPFDPRQFEVGSLEAQVGGGAMLRRFEALGGSGRGGVRGIFEDLAAGSDLAEAVIDETARLVAQALAVVAAVLDPELVVMGGQIGLHPQMFARVCRHVPRFTPIPMRFEPSSLGARAQLVGALGTGIDLAYAQLFGAKHASGLR